MTQEHISHPEGLPNCAAGHRARHIHDKRCASAGGGHLVECTCRSTSKHADPDVAIAAWRRLNRPARSARPAAVPAAADNVLQFQLGLGEHKPKTQRAALLAN
ncbi:TPA: hypothetical protein ACKP89_000868 [Stenotrophomonas maltophilia]|jgi:hypothetical protein|uniref:hypothetical protein n=2 Tax=Stenotrophomonas maltophilia TaxID=40324 RepID=UPI000C14EC3C|nr:hypothetical protein [Stenotrophomonas maltophilia]MBA0233048.1 hypothetical protein [Stenotrophomonas maltophilia]MBA0267006.1 hypothetical protein [Stenotrophomonas maltophilia]MBA0331262.1 hypothetical protein [Stenotrophomonas maltophilia]MBN5120872.1 hypothetical protein [Stenotrophomonas maltophilia]MBO3003290.1 hypothetical protein [Stenotrophomonas maltophilia]